MSVTPEGIPPLSRVRWAKAHRIVSTRHPPIHLFEDIAEPGDWPLLAMAEAKTAPDITGDPDSVPPGRRVAGVGATYVMAPFTHVSRDRVGRFHDGTFGAYYAARSLETAVAETIYHRARFYRATHQAPGWFSQFRELVGRIDRGFHDLRSGDPQWTIVLNPDDYGPSQALARRLRATGSDGVVYPSVRDPGGQCVAAFWPDVVAIPKPGRLLAYHFDGSEIDLVRDENTLQVFRVQEED